MYLYCSNLQLSPGSPCRHLQHVPHPASLCVSLSFLPSLLKTHLILLVFPFGMVAQSCAGPHSWGEFMGVTALSHPADTLHSLSQLLVTHFCSCIVSVPFRQEHSTASSSSYYLLSTGSFSGQGWGQPLIYVYTHTYLEGSWTTCSFRETTVIGFPLGKPLTRLTVPGTGSFLCSRPQIQFEGGWLATPNITARPLLPQWTHLSWQVALYHAGLTTG